MDSSVELRKVTLDDMCYMPSVFDTSIDGHGTLRLVDVYGELYPNGTDEKPIWFIRHCYPNEIRFAGIHSPGNGFNSKQQPLHLTNLAQKDAKFSGYYKVCDECYGMDNEQPFFKYRFYENYLIVKEADVLDLKGIYFSHAIFKHANISQETSQITQTCLFYGSYEKRPVTGIGNFELCFFPKEEKRDLNDFSAYVYAFDAGVRKDGRRELSMVNFSLDGKAHAIYCLDSEKPVVTTDVTMDASWEVLPYVNDRTCVYKDAIFRFGGKEIHFSGKWGAKGLTAYPRTELSGQSQVFGTWYEGQTPYSHALSITFHENMRAYPDLLRKGGFKVNDDAR